MAGDYDERRYRRDYDSDYDDHERPYQPRVAPGKLSRVGRVYGRIDRAAESAAPVQVDPERIDAAARSSGQALPDALRVELEQSIGADLSGVRIHTDSASGDAAQSIAARAYATGSDIFFAPGTYDPESDDGRLLIAHEVAHTVQQGPDTGGDARDSGTGEQSIQAKLEVSQPGDPLEAEADQVAKAFVRGESHAVQLSASGAIARKEAGGQLPEGGRDPFASEHANVNVRFKGQRITGLAASPRVDIPPEDLPSIEQLHAKLERFKSTRASLGVAALTSVQERPEMRFMRQQSTEQGDEYEFPISYQRNPPTDAVKAFIATDIAIGIVERWIEMKSEWMSDEQLRLDEVGGMPIQGKEQDIERYRQQLIITKTLGALTGSFGGVIGFAVASMLSDDADFIADAAVLGENITSSLDGVGLRGVTKAEKGPSSQTRRHRPKRRPSRRRRRARAGRPGDWNKELNNPKPLHEYVISDTGYSFATDAKGKTVEVSAQLRLGEGHRNQYQQKKAGGSDRQPGDQGGHLIAKIFKGPGEGVNAVAMAQQLNLSAFKQLENTWAKALADGKTVKLKLRIRYQGERPSKITGSYMIDGERILISLRNPVQRNGADQ